MTPSIVSPYIAPYLHDRSAAFSFTFDDGYRHQVENACEIIEPLGICGTFFIIPEHMEGETRRENVISWDEAKDLMARGHELGTHGTIRRKLHEVDAQTLDEQVNGGRKLIGERTGWFPQSYALPGGSQLTDPVLAKIREKHAFVRSGKVLPAARVMGYGNTEKRQWDDLQTRDTIRSAMQAGEWILPIVHAIVEGWAPFRSKDEFRIHCEWLKSQKEKLWIAPMGTVGRYVRHREQSTLKLHDSGEHHCSFSLESSTEEEAGPDLTAVLSVTAASAAVSDGQGRAMTARVLPDRILVQVPMNAGRINAEWA